MGGANVERSMNIAYVQRLAVAAEAELALLDLIRRNDTDSARAMLARLLDAKRVFLEETASVHPNDDELRNVCLRIKKVTADESAGEVGPQE